MKKEMKIGAIVIIILIVLIGGYFLFFRGDSNIEGATESDNSNQQQSTGTVDCGKLTLNELNAISTYNTAEEYFNVWPSAKAKMDCISNNLINCIDSEIIFETSTGDAVFSVKKEGDTCPSSYENLGRTIKCQYTKKQYKEMYDAADEQQEQGSSLIGYSLAFSMGFQLTKENGPTETVFGEDTINCEISGLTREESLKCTDSDGGKNIFEKGKTCHLGICKEDECEGNTVIEYHCDYKGLNNATIDCTSDSECVNGRCRKI